MAVTPYVYDTFLDLLPAGGFAFTSQIIKALLLDDTYTPSSSHEYVDDLTGEIADGSYARQTLTTKTATRTGSEIVLDCDSVVFSALTASNVLYAVFYVHTGMDSTGHLIGYWDLGTATDFTAEDCTLDPGTAGLLSIWT
jgi:hypothetical protein